MTASNPAPVRTNSPGQFEDRILYCAECKTPFVFTVGEQRFYAEKGFQNEPKRCPDCRRDRNRRMGRS